MIQLIQSLANEVIEQAKESRANVRYLRESFETMQGLYDEIMELRNDNQVLFETLSDEMRAEKSANEALGKEIASEYEIVRSGPEGKIKAFYPVAKSKPKNKGGKDGK